MKIFYWRKQFAWTRQMTTQSTQRIPALLRTPGANEQGTDSSLDNIQRLHFTSSLQGQYVAAWTAEVKRLSAPQQKQLMFPNNQGFVGVFQGCHDEARGGWNCILGSPLPPSQVSVSFPLIHSGRLQLFSSAENCWRDVQGSFNISWDNKSILS